MHEQRRPHGKFETDLSAQVCGTSRTDPVPAAKMSCTLRPLLSFSREDAMHLTDCVHVKPQCLKWMANRPQAALRHQPAALSLAADQRCAYRARSLQRCRAVG